MALFKEHRTRSRTVCRVPLECLSQKPDQAFQAMLFNISDDGLYLETDRELKTGDNIFLHAIQEVPREISSGKMEENAGIIRWSRVMERNHKRIFGAGIKFNYPDMLDGIEGLTNTKYYCDLCGKSISFTHLRERKGLVWMCPGCNTYIDNLPEALHNVTSRFIIGNVL